MRPAADRRGFCTALAGLATAASPTWSWGQAAVASGPPRAGSKPIWNVAGAPIEGVHYLRLAERATPALAGRIEVAEFFWYECPFCNALEPALEKWAAGLGPEVAFRRVPVWFRPEPFATQQRLFYAMQSLGLESRLHQRIFSAIHQERARLRTPDEIATFALLNGTDPIAFMQAYASPEVGQRADEARRLTAAAGVRDVPALLIDGRFLTHGALASTNAEVPGNERMLDVADALLKRRLRGE